MIKLLEGKFEELREEDWGRFDLAVADPPDNIRIAYDNYTDDLPERDYVDLLHRWLEKLCRITDGPVFWTFNERWIPDVEAALRTLKIPLIQRIYWHFTFGQSQKLKYTPSTRPLYWLNNDRIFPDAVKIPSARQEKYHDLRAKAGGKLPNNVWEFEMPADLWTISRVCGTFKERRAWHKCQLPEALVERIVKGHSALGARVLDPFVGSGTTVRVCHRLGRDCVGIDMSPTYLAHIRQDLGLTA